MSALFELLRPKQWVKNVFILAPLFFSFSFLEQANWLMVIWSIAAFICASGAVYIYNDIYDLQYDRKHPTKQHRPIASGRVSVGLALIIAPALAIAAVAITMLLPARCSTILALYVGVNLLYTHVLKHMVILDVILIAFGFVLRVFMGGYAIEVQLSPWIIVTTFCLALFLAFSKRYSEYTLYQKGTVTRKNLEHYNQEMLRSFMNISCVTALFAYITYTLDLVQMGYRVELLYTTVFVVYGLFRYMFLLYRQDNGEDPETMILRDPLLLITSGLWLISVVSLRLL
jgi:4-hydroxybenzoate polyprenyltransferase